MVKLGRDTGVKTLNSLCPCTVTRRNSYTSFENISEQRHGKHNEARRAVSRRWSRQAQGVMVVPPRDPHPTHPRTPTVFAHRRRGGVGCVARTVARGHASAAMFDGVVGPCAHRNSALPHVDHIFPSIDFISPFL